MDGSPYCRFCSSFWAETALGVTVTPMVAGFLQRRRHRPAGTYLLVALLINSVISPFPKEQEHNYFCVQFHLTSQCKKARLLFVFHFSPTCLLLSFSSISPSLTHFLKSLAWRGAWAWGHGGVSELPSRPGPSDF